MELFGFILGKVKQLSQRLIFLSLQDTIISDFPPFPLKYLDL